MKTLVTICFTMALFMLAGCTQPTHVPTQPAPIQKQVVPVQEIQYVDATLIVGKTNKQSVLDSLGTPGKVIDQEGMSIFGYSFDKYNNIKARLSITMRDGFKYNLIMGKDEQHRTVSISFDKKGIIESINF